MATRLLQVVAFANVGAGAQAALPHSININGVQVVPDFAIQDNGNFDIVSVGATTVTVQNNDAVPASCNVLLQRWHSIERQLGADQTLALSPQPFVPATGGGGGGGTPLLAFRYTVTGAEPDLSDFTITLPVAQGAATYKLAATLAGVVQIVGLDFPLADRTVNDFRLIATAPLQAGDAIDFLVTP